MKWTEPKVIWATLLEIYIFWNYINYVRAISNSFYYVLRYLRHYYGCVNCLMYDSLKSTGSSQLKNDIIEILNWSLIVEILDFLPKKVVHFCFGSNAINQRIVIIMKKPLNAPKIQPSDWFIIWLFFDSIAMFSIFVSNLVKTVAAIKSRVKVKILIIQSSKSTISIIFSETNFVFDMEIRIAIISPTNLPNSSTSTVCGYWNQCKSSFRYRQGYANYNAERW